MSNDSNMSALDRAIAAAKAHKAKRDAAGGAPPAPKRGKSPAKPDPKADEKAAARAERDAARAAKAQERAAARAARAAEKAAEKANKVPHMTKVEKAASRLPQLSDAAQALYEQACELQAGELTALLAHAAHFNRVRATKNALSRTLNEGDVVRIISGDPRYIGAVGVLATVQRIRCYVELPDSDKLIYLFTSDVEPTGDVVEQVSTSSDESSSDEVSSDEVSIDDEAPSATGTDG